MAVPRARRCFHPPDRLRVSSRSRPSSPAISSTNCLRARSCLRPHAVGPPVEVQVLVHRQVVVQAEALRHVADALLDLADLLDDVKAQHVAAPAVGLSRPSSMRIVVVLPAPFGPRKPKIAPRSTVKLTRSTAAKSPNSLSGRRPARRDRWPLLPIIVLCHCASILAPIAGRRPF